MHKKYLNQMGFSLVEICVGVALLGTLSVFISTLMLNMGQSGAKAKFDNELTNDTMVMRLLLGKEEICTANLKDKAIGQDYGQDLNFFEIKTLANGDIVTDTQPLINSNIFQGAKIKYKGMADIASLQLKFQSSQKMIGPSEIYREIILNVETDGSNNITRCVAASLNQELENPHEKIQGNGCNSIPTNGVYGANPTLVNNQNNLIRNQIRSFCSSQSYPMNKARTFVPTTVGLSYGNYNGTGTYNDASRSNYTPESGIDGRQYSFTEKLQSLRGPYKNAAECNKQYSFSEGDALVGDRVVISDNGQSKEITSDIICINGRWVPLSEFKVNTQTR